MQSIRIQTSQNITVEYVLAGIGDRIVAYLVDLAIYFAYYVVLFMIQATVGGVFNNGYVMFFAFLPLLFYSLLCETLMNGQTVGKRAKDIRVISLDGSPASFGQYLVRWIFSLIDISFTGSACAVIMISLTEKNQRLGDLVAGTTVIRMKNFTRIQDTIFEETASTYVATYPQVIRLSERDISLIREILNRNMKLPNYTLLEKTANRIKTVLEVEVNSDASTFLLTVIRDYNHLTSQS